MSYSGKRPQAGYHGHEYGPVGLWQLNGNLQDSSGNGLNLTVETGTEGYSDILPGIRAASLNGATSLIYNTTGSALQITGDMTLEFIMSTWFGPSATSDIVGYAGVGATSPANYLYSIQTITPGYLAEKTQSGVGVSSVYPSTSTNKIGINMGTPHHVALVRQSNVYQFYMDGLPFGPPSGALTAPTDGTSAKLRIGAAPSSANFWSGAIASLKIMNFPLNAGQIRDEYNRSLGPITGLLE